MFTALYVNKYKGYTLSNTLDQWFSLLFYFKALTGIDFGSYLLKYL